MQEERVRDAKAGEEPNDVAVEENRLASARGRITAVLQIHFIRDDVLRVARVARLRGAEETEQRALRAQDACELIGQRLALEDVNDAFVAMRTGDVARSVVTL